MKNIIQLRKLRFKTLIPLVCLWANVAVSATSHFSTRMSALSQLESGDNDYALGSHGEITRYQIMPSVWVRYAMDGTNDFRNRPNVPLIATRVAFKIMDERVTEFEKRYKRPPTDFEWALLWHCPGRLESTTKGDRAYAARFCNLCESIYSEYK